MEKLLPFYIKDYTIYWTGFSESIFHRLDRNRGQKDGGFGKDIEVRGKNLSLLEEVE